MAFKSFWVKLIKRINHNYQILENFLIPGKCNLILEFSKSSLKIISLIIQKHVDYEKSNEFFLTGHLLILKSNQMLIFLESCVFTVQKLNIKVKQNLVGLLEKYSTSFNLIVLNNYFKILFLFIK